MCAIGHHASDVGRAPNADGPILEIMVSQALGCLGPRHQTTLHIARLPQIRGVGGGTKAALAAAATAEEAWPKA